MTGRKRKMVNQIEELTLQLAQVSAVLTEKTERLGIAEDYEHVKKQLVDARLEAEEINEAHDRERREIEHKIGLHKIQVEQEIKTATKEAELAVREEGLAAQKTQFEDQMRFMSDRMENEIQSQRDLMEKILGRLPNFERSHHTVEHIGTPPPDVHVKAELTKGE